MKKILIADDERRIVDLISDFLINEGYATVTAYDGNEAVQKFSDDIDLVIVDIMMPFKDGWQVTEEIRKTSDVPIIMLSARSAEFDMLEGFNAGADEYVTKPFSPAVLVKRVNALLKRTKETRQDKNDGLVINREAFTAFLDGEELSLTLKEFELLCHLYENRGRVLSREQLLSAVWGYDFEGDSRTVDSHIARLRTKLSQFGATNLKTVYGFGYKLL